MIDWEAAKNGKRPLRTKDGRSAHYLGRRNTKTDLPNVSVVEVIGPDGSSSLYHYSDDGHVSLISGADVDLLLTQESEALELTFYENIYSLSMLGSFDTRKAADSCAGPGRIVCVKTTIHIQDKKVTVTGGNDGC